MHLVKEILLVYGRIITILPLLLIATFFMGKRSIGELPVFDFLIILTLGAVVGADIADPKIEHIHTGMAVIGLAVLQRLSSSLIIRNRKIGKKLTFEPTIVIKDGIFQVKNLKKLRYSIDNVLQMLREKDVFDLSIVQLAIIEANGKISVYKQEGKTPVTIDDMRIMRESEGLTFPIIMDGIVDEEVLEGFNKNKNWLIKELSKMGIQNLEDVFFASINNQHKLHVSPKQYSQLETPLKH
jgi:uncharacterized membrane protein YcaP (DUF421 family)